MGKHFSYDWFKSGDVKAGILTEILPDIDGTWDTAIGICQDLAAVMYTMLRSQGILSGKTCQKRSDISPDADASTAGTRPR